MLFARLAQKLLGQSNRLYRQRAQFETDGVDFIDLTRGNVSETVMQFPKDVLDQILMEAAEGARIYKPDPLGQETARLAVSQWYQPLRFDPDQILFTPGTSLSYLYLFKLLAEVGDEILCPKPTYPLFDEIAKICGVTLTSYNLDEDRAWQIDIGHLERQITSKTRAIVVISPHNPTGAVLREEETNALARVASRNELPIISDEVFSEFVFDGECLPRVASTNAPLVFTLNGLSKNYALPGMKLGWIVASGDRVLVRKSLDALMMMSDALLPVNEIAQHALPSVLERGAPFLATLKAQIMGLRDYCLEVLSSELPNCDFFSATCGGFYLTLPIDSPEEEVAFELLKEEKVLVHPGYFYDAEGSHLIFSFVHERERLADALAKISKFAGKPVAR